MREEETETCNLTFEGILEPPHNSPFIWRDAVRHRHAVITLARQLAFKETGEVTANEIAAHFKEHQPRLIAEAEKVIATRVGFARWRFSRRKTLPLILAIGPLSCSQAGQPQDNWNKLAASPNHDKGEP